MTFQLPHTKPVFKHQPDTVLDQANPDNGKKYTVLETKNVRIISIMVQCTWSVQPSPLELYLTIDGVPWKWSFTDPQSVRAYVCQNTRYLAEDAQVLEYITGGTECPFLLEGRSVKIEAEITGGTVSNLSARVKWAKME